MKHKKTYAVAALLLSTSLIHAVFYCPDAKITVTYRDTSGKPQSTVIDEPNAEQLGFSAKCSGFVCHEPPSNPYLNWTSITEKWQSWWRFNQDEKTAPQIISIKMQCGERVRTYPNPNTQN